MKQIFLLLLIVSSGCAFSIGGKQNDVVEAPFYGLSSVGWGETELEAEQAARRDAATKLREKGYTSFDLSRTSKLTSAFTSGDKSRVEMTAGWTVKNAIKGKGGVCHCSSGSCHHRDHDEH